MMNVQILGAHSNESKLAKCVSLLIDDTLAIDAGGLTSSLSLKEQKRLKAILLTHAHFDHIKDIPLLALNLYRMDKSIKIYSLPVVNSTIKNQLLNGCVYPLLQKLPVKKPTVRFHSITPFRERRIEGYRVLPVPVNHDGNTVGYQVGNSAGKALFYTADTGPGLLDCWQHLSFQLLIVDTTFPNSYEEYARDTGHLTPNLLLAELTVLRQIKGDLPRIIAIHRDPMLEDEIVKELGEVAAALNIPITVANEGMKLSL
jgi:ribonuclease BN (tRNA processing enzyme)